MAEKFLNVSNILRNLILKNPYNQLFFTNILNCELKSDSIFINFPDVKILKTLLERHEKSIKTELTKLFGLGLSVMFSPINGAFLPIPASNSKYRNYLSFITIEAENLFYAVIRKPQFYSYIEKGIKPDFIIYDRAEASIYPMNLFFFLKEMFLKLYPVLKDEWSYLHPIILFKDYETMFLQKIIFENVFAEIEKKEHIIDIRRFIGEPCFTVFDYNLRGLYES